MKQIERVLSVKEAETLRQHLRGKRFNFRNRYEGYEEAIHYTTNRRKKMHFLFFPHISSEGEDMIRVQFHIDNVYEGHHKISTSPEDYRQIFKWLNLPSELAFDLKDAFTKEKWIAKRFRTTLGGKEV